MYMRNLKYVKGHKNVDDWVQISESGAVKLLAALEKYAKEKGYNIPLYMEFVKENIVKEVAE